MSHVGLSAAPDVEVVEERDFAQAWKRATLTDIRLISTEIERSCFNFRGISSPQI